MKHCTFRTSYGGALYCLDDAYLEGFCKFHHRAFRNGEINDRGVLNERLANQTRRREINYHGIARSEVTYLDDLE